MRAILIATGWIEEMGALLTYRPSPLLNVAGKPIAHHVLEYLYKLGIKQCDILLHHQPLAIRNSLGDGSRWNMHLEYHLCKDASVPFKTLIPIIRGWPDDVILLGTLETLPQFKFTDKQKVVKQPIAILTPSKDWTKWGIFPLSSLIHIPWDLSYQDIPLYFHKHSKVLTGKTLLSVESYTAYKNSNIKSLKDHSNSIHMPTTTNQIEKGIWVSKGVSIHPKAKIIPPVFFGENTFVEEDAEVGPNVVIESNCIIDRKSKLTESLVCKNSYVGEALTISNSIIDRNLLINTNLKSEVSIIEDFIISEMKTQPIKYHVTNLLEKLIAAALLLLFFPIIVAVWPFSTIKKTKVIKIPSHHLQPETQTFDLYQWESSLGRKYPFFHSFVSGIPKLVNIIRGDFHFVGLPPRTPEEVRSLPKGWKSIYLHSHTGIINLANIEKTPRGDIDQQFACEVYQTIHSSPLFSLKLMTQWLTSKKLSDC